MELPSDIEAAAEILALDFFPTTSPAWVALSGAIARFALAERLSATERAAKIAENAYDSNNHADRSPRHIAAAIRSRRGE